MTDHFLISKFNHICRKLFLLFLVVSTGAVSAAEMYESVKKDRPRLGVQVGAAFSTVTSPADIDASYLTGFAAGARVDVPLTTYLSVQSELTLVQRGMTLARVGGYSATEKYTTLQIPILLKATLPSRPVVPYLTAGPVAFLNLSHSLNVNSPGENVGNVVFEPRTFELGFSLGVGVEFGPLFLATNYLIGLSQLDDNSAQYQSKGVQVMGGVQF